jgi:hypothetical protein
MKNLPAKQQKELCYIAENFEIADVKDSCIFLAELLLNDFF